MKTAFLILSLPILFLIETIAPEKITFFFFLIASVAFFFIFRNKREVLLYLIGLLLGIFIEVILGLISRHQFWEQTGLFGVPLWLPFAWGLGFVIIRRLGNSIVDSK